MASNSSKTQVNLNLFTTLRVFITDILGETVQFLQTTFKQANSVFTLASPFGQILLVLENLAQLIFYYIEDSTTEQNIFEASRPSSVYSLASLAGHNPTRAIGSAGEVQLRSIVGATDLPANKVVMPNYTRLVCLNNNLTYVAILPQDSVTFSVVGIDNNMKFQIKQGNIEVQTFQATGDPFFSCQIGFPNNFMIDHFFVNVYVNGVKWKKYDSLLDIPLNAQGYLTRTGVSNGLDIFFGNKSMGAIPPAGAIITVEYIVTDGAAGNLRTDDPTQIYFQFKDTVFTTLGDEINLNQYVDILTTNPPQFGVDPEPLALTRLVAPHTSRSFALVNTGNYEIVLAKMQLFSTVRVTIDDMDPRMVDLFLIPDTKKFYSNGEDYFRIDTNLFVLSDFQKNQIYQYIAQLGTQLISTDYQIIDPILRRYVLNVSVITFDDTDPETSKADIINALGNYFISASRTNRIPKSDLIAVIEALNSVDSVAINVVCEQNELNKAVNPMAIDVGVDAFNDIIIQPDEFAVIRGGWTDRYGNQYAVGLSDTQLGAVNIQIVDQVPRNSNLVAYQNTNTL
jgi:hypothetical protein